ncbi:MAG TPA: TonB-dependent receptor [Caulobacteraceae bacterium]|jgi:outer membrane receptor protein involved in Fe transport
MYRRSLFAAASLAILAMCASARAEEAAAPPVNRPPAQTPPADPPSQANGTTVGAIVVTANKREQNINEVPMSISAATGDQLTRLGVVDTQQLTKIVPGFNYTPTPYGTPVYSIRGVGFVDTSLAASPTVSVYRDEIPLPYSILSQGASLDLQRLEVLKGPQGTLFGENATGGAVNYISNKPTDTLQAGMDLSYGRFNTLDAQGFVSGPIVGDVLDFRLAARVIRSDDWQYDYNRDATSGAQRFFNTRAMLSFKPTDNFRALLTLSYWQDNGDTQQPQLYGFAPLNPVNGVDPRIIGTGPYIGGDVWNGSPGHYPFAPANDRAADWGSCVNSSPFDPPFNTTGSPPWGYTPATGGPRPIGSTSCVNYHKNNIFYSADLRMDYDLPDGMTLTSITAYEMFTRFEPLDGSGMIYQDFQSIQHGIIDTWYQELRLAGKFYGKGNWLVGANYEHDSTWDNFLQTYGDSSASPVFGLRLGPTNPVDRQKTATAAVYGNAEYPVTDRLTIHAGLRYTDQWKTYHGCGNDGGDGTWSAISQQIQNYLESVYNPPNGVQGQGINPGPYGCGTTGPGPTFNPTPFNETLDQDNVSGRVSLDYHPVEDTLLYVTASQGWKSGAFPTVATSSFKQLVPAVQERLDDYEAGFKSAFFNHSLQLDGAFFYYHYKNKQILGALDDPIFGALPALVNVPHSHVIGFEFSSTWIPIKGLTLTPAVSFQHSRIDGCTAKDDPVNCVNGQYYNFDTFAQYANFTGEAFPDSPEFTLDFDGEYDWPVGNDMTAFIGANVNYASATSSFLTDDAASSQYPASLLQIPSRALLDLRAGVSKGPWRLQLWGHNVTNAYYWLSADHVNDVLVRYAGMPVTYGVLISYRFK